MLPTASMVLLIQALFTGVTTFMAASAGMPWPGTVGLTLLGVAAMAAAAPSAGRLGQVRTWALCTAWACTVIVLTSALVAHGGLATVSTYLDSYYQAQVWMIATLLWPASRPMPHSPVRARWRLLVIIWAMLGGLLWVVAAYARNRSWLFFGGLLVFLGLLVLCHFWFRLRTPGIIAVNTFILLIIGLPLADVLVRCVSSLGTELNARRQYYLYDVAKKNPVAFGRWWNYYVVQWRRAEKKIYERDPDPILAYHLRPHSHARVAQSTFSINSRGFRGREIAAEKGDAYRIVALGESTTFGVTLSPEDRPWPELLEQLIRERLKPRRPVEVINAGVPGYRLDQNLRRFAKDILPLKPDMVISYHGINAFSLLRDAVPFAPAARPPAYKERPLRLLADAEYRLRLIRFQHRQPPRHTPHPGTLADPLATPYAALYRQLIQLAQTNHFRLVLANFSMAVNEQSDPALVEFYQPGNPDAAWQIQANRVHSTIVRELAEQHPEVCFVDTHPHLDGEHDKFIDLVHFAPPGDRQLAENFYDALRPILTADLFPALTTGRRSATLR